MLRNKSKCCNAEIASYNREWDYCTECLKQANILKTIYPFILLFLIVLMLLFSSFTAMAPENNNKLIIKDNLKELNNDIELNDSSILKYMKEIDIVFPELVLQQIHWESSHFKSKICKENKNLLGIKYIKQKLAVSENKGHAKYNSYKECLLDYKRLQKYYINNLKRYAEDPKYTIKLFNRE
jgi:uncharacterized FlgJ-related protein